MTNWILVDYTATSLYNVIADGNYRMTNVGRAEWMSLINGTSLQDFCNKEGFNAQCSSSGRKSRIGILGNGGNNCVTCDSVIGLGFEMKGWKWSSGNIDDLPSRNRDKKLKTFGYILVQ